MREPGFYWIQARFMGAKLEVWSKPVVAEFDGVEWWTPGSEEGATEATPVVVLSDRLLPPDRQR